MKLRIYYYSILCSLFFISSTTAAQSVAPNDTRAITTHDARNWQYVPAEEHGVTYFELEMALEIPVTKDGPFITFAIAWDHLSDNGDIHAFEYFNQGEWQSLALNHHIENPIDAQRSELGFLSIEEKNLRLKIITEGQPDFKFESHFFNPGHTPKNTNSTTSTTQRSLICPCPPPDYQDRSEWCPNGDCPPNPNPTSTNVELLVVHHSAGTNSSSDWAAVVRSIWNFHVNTNNWSDVGYNWLIDPEGTLYEGRGQGILGAHFCAMNSGTMGVCMIGDYTNITPPDTAVTTLTKMLAWNSCEENLDPLGTSTISSYDIISGHRDGCATQCPGNSFYPTLPDVRQAVADYIDNECTELIADLLVDTIFTNTDQIIASDPMLLRCRITNNSNAPLQDILVDFQIDGNTLYTKTVSNLNSGSSTNLSQSHTFPMAGEFEYCVQITPLAAEMNTENNNYCGDLSVEVNTATEELAAAQLSIFPNPSKGAFFLRNPALKSGQLQVFNALGQIILDTNLQGEQLQEIINLDQQAKGVYVLRVMVDGKAYFEKLMLQ